jgi:hypothetical protein
MFRIVCVCILLMTPALALAQKDTLHFKNGTIVIGEVQRIQMGVISFDPDDANDITVQLRKLSSIHAASRYFKIETVDLQIIYGKLLRSADSGYVNVLFGVDTTKLALNNISNLYPIEKSFNERINGTIGAGYSYTRSSELGRLNIDATARYVDREFEVITSFSAISTIDNGDFFRDNEDAGLGLNHYFHTTWYSGAILNYQRNIELGIKSRYQEGAGFGNKLLVTRYFRLLAFSGIVLNQENSVDGVYSGLLTEGVLGIQFNVYRFEKPELDIDARQNGFISFSQSRWRYDGNISISWEMVEDLDLQLSFYSNYDSRPPGENSANYDYGTVISIAFEF